MMEGETREDVMEECSSYWAVNVEAEREIETDKEEMFLEEQKTKERSNESETDQKETEMVIGSGSCSGNDHHQESNLDNYKESLMIMMDVEEGDNENDSVSLNENDILTQTTITETSTGPIATESGSIIQAIDRKVVHQICSGQVIVTLSTAVKELLENSIDAGATSVDIRLIQYGSELIEVIDNGSGVDEENLEGFALKHHTSKISEFEDISSVATFGFRGEAISSLSALSNMTVITKCKSDKKNPNAGSKTGWKIEYDSEGKIVSKTACAREHGMTISLKNIFAPLPVRHREFLKNLKREFHKMVNVLYGYCLVAQGVRITCTNQVGNGPATKVVSVPASQITTERIVSVFGSKQIQNLMEFEQEECLNEESLTEFGLTAKTFIRDKFTIEGYISTPNHGRSSNDRQFFFVNSRPCDPVKLTRIINEVYHGYSKNQSPFVYLNIKTRQENVDVNVTPDKRVLYLQNEKSLYAIMKASLITMLNTESSTYNLSTAQKDLSFSFYGTQSQSQNSLSQSSNSISESQSSSSSDQLSLPSSQNDSQKSQKNNNTYSLQTGNDFNFAPQLSTSKSRCNSKLSSNSPSSYVASKLKTKNFLQSFARNVDKDGSSNQMMGKRSWIISSKEVGSNSKQKKLFDFVGNVRHQTVIKIEEKDKDVEMIQENEFLLSESQEEGIKDKSLYMERNDNILSQSQEESLEDCEILYDDELNQDFDKNEYAIKINVDWDELMSRIRERGLDLDEKAKKEKNYASKFRAKIAPGENEKAEEELKKQLTKEMFSKMEIIGQFNLGFILVRFGPDIFIVDQHASDEKYNFEDLEKTTVLQTQKLIRPLDLELPAVSENIIIDNLETFQKNGFDFDINAQGKVTKRVKLIQIPFSKSCQFGKSDVDELIFMMEDGPEKCFCRPSKLRLMLASRACRKSVMIGTAMNSSEMRKIMNHMGEMEQPWNCPHGRPTIRHLININLLPDLNLQAFNH